jgi:acetyl-CoA decarbonylase/synthase complex subunit gamma
LLVLDTDGINVWCAAGKGTLGTEALVHSIVTNGLAGLVVHRTVVLPQLAAPGVAAHAVKSASGFRVVYGPIRAADVEAFVRAGMKADPEQRRKTFGLVERAVLIPVELVEAVRWALILSPALLVIGGLTGPAGFWANVLSSGVFAVLGMFSGVVAGAIATPLLLPWLPGRAFSVKGIVPGLVAAAAVPAWRGHLPGASLSGPEAVGWTLMIVAIASYLAMNFTGASTYTSLSGVRKEMRFALPAQVAAVIVGLGLWLLPSLLS